MGRQGFLLGLAEAAAVRAPVLGGNAMSDQIYRTALPILRAAFSGLTNRTLVVLIDDAGRGSCGAGRPANRKRGGAPSCGSAPGRNRRRAGEDGRNGRVTRCAHLQNDRQALPDRRVTRDRGIGPSCGAPISGRSPDSSAACEP